MDRNSFTFNLPQYLIAQKRTSPNRTKLLTYLLKENRIIHSYFNCFAEFIEKGDLLVFNDSAVMPSRMWGVWQEGGQVEVHLVDKIRKYVWEVLVRPDDGINEGGKIFFNKNFTCKLLKRTSWNGWLAEFDNKYSDTRFGAILENLAEINTPFYIRKTITDMNEYQNIYARKAGSMQCPTAGLHFTREFLNKIKKNGVRFAYITLHVGGSILPLSKNKIKDLKIYKEYYQINNKTVKEIAAAKKRGSRVIAIGTTVTRALESAGNDNGTVVARNGWTDLTITPSYKFKVVDGLLTNFHLPASSHILLTTALTGEKNILPIYVEAIKKKYRFLDFGDAMLLI